MAHQAPNVTAQDRDQLGPQRGVSYENGMDRLDRGRLRSLLLLASFCLVSVSVVPFPAEVREFSTIYRIEIAGDGLVTWTVEHRFYLKTQQDEEYFQEYISEFEPRKADYLEEFSSKMERLVERASIITGRSMSARNFDISLGVVDTATGKYGVIKYRFDWAGFARLEGEKMIIGDVFEGGLFLSKDEALIIRYPNDYTVDTVLPSSDEARQYELIWYGLRDFGSGEPRVVLQKKPAFPIALPITWIGAGIVVLAVLVVVALSLRRSRRPTRLRVREEVGEFIGSDTDRIIELLKLAGGALYQSEIVKKTGFSKSKTSALLNSMEGEGTIERIRKGRKNLVKLKTAR